MKKNSNKSGSLSVTFELPPIEARSAALCGDFNSWSPDAHPMRRRKDGIFVTTLRLPPGEYRFRYLVDGDRWMNDWNADRYDHNDFGSDNSVLVVLDGDSPTQGG